MQPKVLLMASLQMATMKLGMFFFANKVSMMTASGQKTGNRYFRLCSKRIAPQVKGDIFCPNPHMLIQNICKIYTRALYIHFTRVFRKF
jgi:hypothetical protein